MQLLGWTVHTQILEKWRNAYTIIALNLAVARSFISFANDGTRKSWVFWKKKTILIWVT